MASSALSFLLRMDVIRKLVSGDGRIWFEVWPRLDLFLTNRAEF
jgi:hypothetical protein